MSDITVNNKHKFNDKIYFSKINATDHTDFINLHAELLMPNADTRFITKYLKLRLDWLLKNNKSTFVLAKDNNMKLIGFVYGCEEGYKKKMNRAVLFKLLLIIFMYPKVVLNIDIFNKVKSFFRSPKSDINEHIINNSAEKLQKPVYQLIGIAVKSEFGREGVGRNLLLSFEEHAKSKGFSSIILKTPTWNEKAIKFYLKNRWSIYTKNRDTTYFYKIIGK